MTGHVMAAWPDRRATVDSRSRARRAHIVVDDTATCGPTKLDLERVQAAAAVPPEQRCKRPRCRDRWPGR